MFSTHPKLVIATYAALTISMLLLLFLFPNNEYKIWLAILIPFIVWLPFDILWLRSVREQKRNSTTN